MALTPGMKLSTIMDAGEWRSSAVFKYVRPEDADVQSFLAQAIDAGDGGPRQARWPPARSPPLDRAPASGLGSPLMRGYHRQGLAERQAGLPSRGPKGTTAL